MRESLGHDDDGLDKNEKFEIRRATDAKLRH
jgi:hypothetical protein